MFEQSAVRPHELSSFLRRVPLFSELGEPELTQLARIAINRSFPKDTLIFQEGDFADSLYLIREGQVKVLLSSPEGREVIVSILKAEDYFGEMALIDTCVRCARVVTMSNCQFTLIGRSEFDRLIHNSPQMALALLRSLANRLRAANRRIGSLATLDVLGRVAKVLLDEAEREGDDLVVSPIPKQKDIAAMVGASREMVNRAYRELVDNGYITVTAKHIVINNKLAELDLWL